MNCPSLPPKQRKTKGRLTPCIALTPAVHLSDYLMKLSYTDKIAPVQADGTVAMFVVRNVEEARINDPTAGNVVSEPRVKKLLRKKVDALKITLSLVRGSPTPTLISSRSYRDGWENSMLSA
jgi:hypothetical protein